jgi:hypothetical protein
MGKPNGWAVINKNHRTPQVVLWTVGYTRREAIDKFLKEMRFSTWKEATASNFEVCKIKVNTVTKELDKGK